MHLDSYQIKYYVLQLNGERILRNEPEKDGIFPR